MDIKNKVLETIEKDNIHPRSELFFGVTRFVNYLVLALGITLVIGLLCLAILNILEAGNLAGLILVPIFVLGILASFVFIILFQKSIKSDDFYKFSRFKFAGFLLGLIISGMLVWNIFGTARAADIALQNSKEYCKTMKKATYVRWSSPEEGYLAGEVQEKPVSPRTFMIKDLRRNTWEIHPIESLDINFINQGELVKMRGEIIDPRAFRANEIYLWEGKMWFDILD
jgi:hypothetical protein